MHLIYVDESGDPYSWENQKHFVLGSLAIHEGQINKITKKMDEIQSYFFPEIQLHIPFHAVDIVNHRGYFKELSREKRDELMMAIYDIIGRSRFPNIIAFATIISIDAVKNHQQAFDDVLEDMCIRINNFMKRQLIQGHPTKGLLIIDQAHQTHYRKIVSELQRTGSKQGILGHIVDIPYFAGRKDTRMLQLADFINYALFRYYEKNEWTYIRKILPRFDKRNSKHPPDGLKHITKNKCYCESCKWRDKRNEK